MRFQGIGSLLASFNHRDPIFLCILCKRADPDELGDLWGASRQDIPL